MFVVAFIVCVFQLDIEQSYPCQWNGHQEWLTKLILTDVSFAFVYPHINLVSGIRMEDLEFGG